MIIILRNRQDEHFLAAVVKEIAAARAKFPEVNHQCVALAEEMGETAQALIEHGLGNKTPEQVFAEAVQTAAMALRVAVEGDNDFPLYKSHRDEVNGKAD